VAAGSSYGSQHSSVFTLVRYHTNGALDASFGGGTGVVTASSGDAAALVQQTDGMLVVAGSREIGSQHQVAFGITRYRSDGMLIPTKPITESERRRSPDPIEAEHHVRPMPSGPSRSEATLVSGLLR
jgi:hypothetical protein